MKKLQLLALVCGISLFCLSGLQAQEKYPSRPIEMVVPFGPGGSSDTCTRMVSEELGKVLNTTVTVVNRTGGSATQGTTYVAKAKKDGYTLLGTSGGPIFIMPNISKEVQYDPLKDFIPLGQFASVPTCFAVKSDSPFKTLGDLIAYAQKNPGKVKNANVGLGSESDFNVGVLCTANKMKITAVPYNAAGEAMAALLGGHVDLTTLALTSLGPQIKAGKLRALAITSKSRNPLYPDIPTTAESGNPEVKFVMWVGFFAPAGVPQSVLDVLIPSLDKAMKNPELVQRAKKAGFMVDSKGAEEFRKFVESEIQVAAKVAKDADLIQK